MAGLHPVGAIPHYVRGSMQRDDSPSEDPPQPRGAPDIFHGYPEPMSQSSSLAGRTQGAAGLDPAFARRPSIAILIAISAISPLGINMYLPSMPGMAASLGVDFSAVQLTLSLYLAAVALAQLVVGPLSDSFGRRPVLMGGLALFIAGSLICALAPGIEVLLFGRVVQAAGGCAGIVLGRAIVRDLYDRNEAASMIGYVTMGMAVAPMLAPSVGGLLDTAYGWRSSFFFLILTGSAILAASALQLHETNPRVARDTPRERLVSSYASLARSRAFWGYALTTSFSSAVFFAFLAGASFVTITLMGQSSSVFGFYMGSVAAGYILGNFLSGRFAGRVGAKPMMLAGLVLALASLSLMAGLFAAGLFHPIVLFAPMFLVGAANGIVLPSGFAGAVSVRPDLAGAASGLAGSLQIGMGALVTPILGALLGQTVWPLIAVMIACASLAALAFLLVRKDGAG